jgi:hypothetical protein
MAQKFTVPVTIKNLSSAGSDGLTVFLDQESFARLKVEAGGRITWGAGAGAGDTNLYRDAESVLKTDDTFKAAGLYVGGTQIDTLGATVGDALVFNGTKFVSASVAAGGGGASLTVSDTPPAGAEEGDLWFSSLELEVYVYYSSAWIQVTDSSSGVQELYELVDVLIDNPISGEALVYNGTEWVNGLVSSGAASSLETARIIQLSGDVSGSVSFDGSQNVSIAATIQPNSVALGTDTTGNYVNDVTAGTGVTITHTPGEGSSPTIAIGQAVATSSSVSFARLETSGDVVVGGDLTVNGTTTTLNTETLLVEDNIVVLNSGVTATPTLDSGIEIERGTSANVLIRWNETNDQWEFTNDGTTYGDIAALGAIELGTDTTGNFVSDITQGTGVTVTHTPGEGSSPTIAIGQAVETSSSVQFATVTAPLIGNASTASALETARTISLGGDLSGSASFNGTTDITISASVVNSGVNLDEISDVVITSPLQFQGLMYDGTNWVNSNIPDVYLVRNNTGSTILKGTLVGAVGAEPSGRIDVAPFQVTGTENSELRAMGIATSNISSGVNGEVMSFGTLTGLDTRGSTASALAVGDETWAAGDILFAHPTVDGKLTNVRPQHDLAVAFITVRHASTGQIAIRIIPGNNHLEWMHDVSLVDKTSGDFLKYNGTLWVNDQINLGTDTVGNYLSDLTQGTGVTITHTPSEGSNATIAIGQAVDTSASVTFAQVNTTGDVVVGGNLTVNGTTTTLNTETLAIEDNIVVLNSGVTGSPTVNAGIEVERGTSANVDLRWNESTDKWEFTNDGSTYSNLGAGGATISDTPPSSPVTGQIWYESDTGKTFVYYDSFWIEIVGSTGAQGPTGATGAEGATGATGATGAAGLGVAVPMVSTYYHKTPSSNSTQTWQANRTAYVPFFIAESTTLDRIAIRTGTTFSGTATVRIGIYDSTNGQPSTVELDAGTVSATASSTTYEITINHTLSPGLYFLAQNSQVAATTNNYFSANNSYLQMPVGLNISATISTGWREDVTVTGGFATAATLSLNANTPDVWIRKT